MAGPRLRNPNGKGVWMLSLEAWGMLAALVLLGAGCIRMIRADWRCFGALYLMSAVSANCLCYLITLTGFYSFPRNVLHGSLLIPYGLVSTAFPLIAMVGVRYSPERWVWKIPFYWTVIHLGFSAELLLLITGIFQFGPKWDLWDSYTLWWIYYLLFELLGKKLIPRQLRKPINAETFRYGNWGWIIVHVVLIASIFGAGVYVGATFYR